MTVTQVSHLWGLRLILSPNGQGCTITPIRARTMGGYALFQLGRFRAVFFGQGATTDRGVHIGSTLARLGAAYKPLGASRHEKGTTGRQYYVHRKRWYLRFDVD